MPFESTTSKAQEKAYYWARLEEVQPIPRQVAYLRALSQYITQEDPCRSFDFWKKVWVPLEVNMLPIDTLANQLYAIRKSMEEYLINESDNDRPGDIRPNSW